MFYYTQIAFDKRVTFWLMLHLFACQLTYNHYAIAQNMYNAANAHAYNAETGGLLKPKKVALSWKASGLYRLPQHTHTQKEVRIVERPSYLLYLPVLQYKNLLLST